MMAGIRVNTGVKRIEVNDNGDYITINLNDNDFMDRFFAAYEEIQRIADESTAKEAEIKERHKENEGGTGFMKDIFALYSNVGREMKEQVESLFGAGTCKKVFGDITPTFDLYVDFFGQLTPYLQEFAAEKTHRMSKYSAARTGNA